jgi:translation initiation factor eIF-2B subunit delta
MYDLTPTKFISMVFTEIGQIPPTSVPVILREFQKYNYLGTSI